MVDETNQVRTQASLGSEFRRTYNEGSHIDTIVMGRILKVNYRYNTVDVMLTKDSTTLTSSHQSEGRFSAKLPIEFGGKNRNGKPYGTISPVQVGDLVLIGFVGGNKSTPIVLSSYGSADNSKELSRSQFSGIDPEDETLKVDADQEFKVYPNLTYTHMDGAGNRTVTFNGKSFLTMDSEASPEASGVTDEGTGYDYEHLASSYYYSGELIEPENTKAPTILFRHQGDKLVDGTEDNHTFLMFLDQSGTYRTSIMNKDEDWRTYYELNKDGEFIIRRQEDSKGIRQGKEFIQFKLNKGGIEFSAGDKYFIFNGDGVMSNALNIGSFEEGLADLERVKQQMAEQGERLISMKLEITKTNEMLNVNAEKVTEVEGAMKTYEADFTLMAELVSSKVSEDKVSGMITEGLIDFSKEIEAIDALSKESLAILAGLSDDNLVTAIEKQTLLREWDMIKAEYPGYLAQAGVDGADVSTEEFTRTYTTLKNYIEPILADMDSSTSIESTVFNRNFTNYYTAKSNVLYAIFNKMKSMMDAAVKQAVQAGKDAGDAGIAADDARRQAEKSTQILLDIASDGILTVQEKPQLRKEYQAILHEWQNIVKQATPYAVDTSSFVSAKEAIDDFITSTGLLSNMQEDTEVDGTVLSSLFNAYYEARSAILSGVSSASRDILDEFKGDLEHFNTEIIQTARQIKLVADSVIILGEDVSITQAKVDIQAHKIQFRVSATEFKREVNESLDRLNAMGRNLYIKEYASRGTIDAATGETVPPVDGDMVNPYLKATASTTYTATLYENEGLNRILIAWYDYNKKFISADIISDSIDQFSLTATSPEGTYFARLTSRRTETLKIQFEVGTKGTKYKVSPEDMAVDIDAARQEQASRQETMEEAEEVANGHNSNAIESSAIIADLVSDNKLTPAEKTILRTQWSVIASEYDFILSDLTAYGIDSNSYTGRYVALREYMLTTLANMETESTVVGETIKKLYTDYYTERSKGSQTILAMATRSLEAANTILDKTTTGVVEAERIARELATNAEAAARDTTAIRNSILTARDYETSTMASVNNISNDDQIDAVERVQLNYLWETITEEQEILTTQANVYSLSTADRDNTFNQLDSYISGLLNNTGEKDVVPINKQTFRQHFQTYFTAKMTLLGNILDGANGVYEKAQQQSDIAWEEAKRREEQLQIYQNAIIDSQAQLERIEETIEEIKDTVPYRFEMTSSNGTIFKDRNINTTLSIKVFKGDEDLTDSIPKEDFIWLKADKNGVADVIWNKAHEGVGTIVHLTDADVDSKATFDVVLP